MPGRRGVRALRAAIAMYHDPGFTRSELERRLARLCREGGLEPPSFNLWIAGYEVDAVWVEKRVVVELDSFEYHRTRAAFERDRRRDAALHAAGYVVLRVTDIRLATDPDGVLAELRALLGRDQQHRPTARGARLE